MHYPEVFLLLDCSVTHEHPLNGQTCLYFYVAQDQSETKTQTLMSSSRSYQIKAFINFLFFWSAFEEDQLFHFFVSVLSQFPFTFSPALDLWPEECQRCCINAVLLSAFSDCVVCMCARKWNSIHMSHSSLQEDPLYPVAQRAELRYTEFKIYC